MLIQKGRDMITRRSAATGCAAAVLATAGLGLVLPGVASASSVSCSKHIGNTVGTITCTSSGGSYSFSDVYADCSAQRDKHYGRWTINGTSTLRFECRHNIHNIYAVV